MGKDTYTDKERFVLQEDGAEIVSIHPSGSLFPEGRISSRQRLRPYLWLILKKVYFESVNDESYLLACKLFPDPAIRVLNYHWVWDFSI